MHTGTMARISAQLELFLRDSSIHTKLWFTWAFQKLSIRFIKAKDIITQEMDSEIVKSFLVLGRDYTSSNVRDLKFTHSSDDSDL